MAGAAEAVAKPNPLAEKPEADRRREKALSAKHAVECHGAGALAWRKKKIG